MNWESFFSGAVGAGVLAIALRLLDNFLTRNKSKAEALVLNSQASENINDAAQVAANILLQALNFKQVENKEYQERVRALEENQKKNDELVKDLTKHKAERDSQIAELQEQNEALQSKQAALQAQIEKDTSETEALRKRVAEMEQKYGRMKRINEKLVRALQDANIPLPDLNGDLTDSMRGFKWDKK